MHSNARALLLGVLLFGGLLAPSAAQAEDACTATLNKVANELGVQSCSPGVARGNFQFQRPVACDQAMQRGEAPESLARILSWVKQPIGPALHYVDCIPFRQQEALFVLCTLHPPDQQSWLRQGIADTHFNREMRDAEITGACMSALMHERDAEARTAALSTSGLLKVEGALRIDAIRAGFQHAAPHAREQLVPLLREANAKRYVGRDDLHSILCREGEPLPELLRTACAESTGQEEDQERKQQFAREERSKVIEKRAGKVALTALSIALAGLQIGLTVQYRDSAVAKVATTIGGAAAGSFIVMDVFTGLFHDWGGIGILFMPIGGIPLGAAAYGSTYNTNAMIAFSSVTAAFSLASGLTLTWLF